MSTAHIFYLPILLFTGLLAGFFLGRTYTENQIKKEALRRKRLKALKERQEAGESVAVVTREDETSE